MTLAFVFAIAGSAFAAGGTNEDFSIVDAFEKRIGIIAYCADMYHNAGDTGLQSNKTNVKDGATKQALANLAASFPIVPGFGPDPTNPALASLGYLFLDGPFDNLGQLGAQNLADYVAYDDGIDKVSDLQLIDGDLMAPTAQQLINNFDIVVAYTDNKCGPTLPPGIRIQATAALTGFIAAPGKKLILTGFAFSTDLGFGNTLYANGLSPLTKGGPANAACTRGDGCRIGTCPAVSPTGTPCGTVPAPKGPECQELDASGAGTGAICTVYQPVVGAVLGTNNAGDQACREILNGVRGPTTSSWATALTSANVGRGASLCLTYDGTSTGASLGVPFAAINAARNIIAYNAFPPDAVDIQKFWFGCLFRSAIPFLSGDKPRCGGGIFCY
jgi:hypothetical protein